MEKIKIFRVNIDLEQQALRQTRQTCHISWEREWEYLFWWIEPDQYRLLASPFKKYAPEDIGYIKEATGRKRLWAEVKNGKNQPILFWWGEPSLAKKFNKSSLLNIRRDVFGDRSTSTGVPTVYPCLLKKDGGFSGKSNYLLRNEDEYRKLASGKFILEPYREIVQDLSYYVFKNSLVNIQSHVSKKFEYSGSIFHPEDSWILNQQLFFHEQKKIIHFLKSKGHKDSYGVDCYFYLNGEKLELEPLCEINYRRTLASCVYEIYQKYYSQFSYATNILIPSKKTKKGKSFVEAQAVRLSPLKNQYFQHWLLLGNSLEEIRELSDKLQKFFNIF